MTVREAEMSARKIATDRIRKVERMPDPELTEFEAKLAETFGTRVHIEQKEKGGKITIDFFSNDDLRSILDVVNSKKVAAAPTDVVTEETKMLDDRSAEEKEKEENDEIYSVDNFVV